MGNKNIKTDHIFREKLENYKMKAPDDSWATIESQLVAPSKSRRIIPFRYIAAASIALIAVSATLYTLYKFNNSFISNRTSLSELSPRFEKRTFIIPAISQPFSVSAFLSASAIAYNSNSVNKSESLISNSELIFEMNQIPLREDYNLIKLSEKQIAMVVSNNSLALKESGFEQRINTKEQKTSNLIAVNQSPKVRNSGKWAVGLNFAPSYSYRHLSSSGNQESVAYFNTVENPVKSFAGGLNIQYKALKRLTIQTGIYYAQMGQSIGNMTIYNNKNYDNAAPANKENYLNSITLTNSVGNININSEYVFVDQTNIRVNTSSENKFFFDPSDPSLNQLKSNVQQNFEYIDIPLLFSYKFIDKKIDLNVIAGLGASFLVGNQVYLIINETETNIGETKSIKETNYTGNFGLSIDLPIANKLVFRLEPSFKYYFNAINTDTEIKSHPYSLSIFSGFCLSL